MPVNLEVCSLVRLVLLCFITLFFPFIRKIIAIAKRHKTTSIADFLATRYGKSSLLAALVTLIAFVGTLPYIALQIKAISSSFDMLTGAVSLPEGNFHNDTAFILALILAVFSILFGARTVDASQHHKGLIYAIAFESVIKLIAFLSIAYMAFNLVDSLSERDPEIFSTYRLLWLPFEDLNFKPSMLTTLLLAAGADPNRSNINGRTALMAAAWDGRCEMCLQLLKAGADPVATSQFKKRNSHKGDTALYWAQANGHEECAAVLQAVGAV